MALTSYDQVPENLSEYCYVEFTMPATQVSHTTARSVSFQNSDGDNPPEKYVRNLSRHEYRYVGYVSVPAQRRDRRFQRFRSIPRPGLGWSTRRARDQART